jgi:hypothetical protein
MSVADWLFLVPIENLIISDEPPIGGTWHVGPVRFLSKAAAAELIAGSPQTKSKSFDLLAKDLSAFTAFGAITMRGDGDALRPQVFSDIRRACHFLAATTSFYAGRRDTVTGFAPAGYPMHTRRNVYSLDVNSHAHAAHWSHSGPTRPFEVNAHWHTFCDALGLLSMFQIHNDAAIDPAWRRQIIDGTAMLGRSINSLELTEAFIHDIVGLETLLTRPRERSGTVLARRLKGLVGWAAPARIPDYETEIADLHQIRCDIVHDADYSRLTPESLLKADFYLEMAILNIVQNPRFFTSKSLLASKLDQWATSGTWPMAVPKLIWISRGPNSIPDAAKSLKLW